MGVGKGTRHRRYGSFCPPTAVIYRINFGAVYPIRFISTTASVERDQINLVDPVREVRVPIFKRDQSHSFLVWLQDWRRPEGHFTVTVAIIHTKANLSI